MRAKRAFISILSSVLLFVACEGSSVAFDPPRSHDDPASFDTAKFAQIEVDWVSVEPNAPTPGENLTSPSAPEYDFSTIDQRVEEFDRICRNSTETSRL